MSTPSNANPLPLTDSVLRELADLAKVEAARREAFIQGLRDIFALAPKWHQFDQASLKRKAVIKQLARIEKVANRLQKELTALDHHARRELGLSALRHQRFGPSETLEEHISRRNDLIEVADGVAQGEHLLSALQDAVETIQKGAASYEFKASPKGGVPTKSPTVPGNPNTSAADLFVSGVFSLINRHGGELTLDKNSGGGTSVKFFAIAANHLPADRFGLRAPSFSRLQELKKVATAFGQKGQKPAKK